MKVMLRLRDLKNGNASTLEHESVDDACAWLKERPRFTEVLGVVFEGLTHEDNDRMKAAMRPLDDDEKAAEQKLDAAEKEARAKAEALRDNELEAVRAKEREASKNADPNRPIAVRYHYSEGISCSDPNDDRTPNDDVKAAVTAWVEERNEWVESRGQMIGEAKLQCWPGDVPDGKDRIIEGSFVPVTK